MVLEMNILMTVFATLSFSFGISYFIREKEIGSIRWFILMLGIMCGATNLGYMLMSISDISIYTICLRNIGLFGVDLYLYFELLLVLDQIKLKNLIKKTIASFVGVVLIFTLITHGSPSDVLFERKDGFTIYVNNYHIGFYAQEIMVIVFFVTLFVTGLIWLLQQKTKRGRSFVILCFISNFLYIFSSFPYFLGIELEHPAFLYCLGTMLAFFVMWYAGITFSGFNVTTQKLGGDIFGSISVGLLVLNAEGQLIMKNESARDSLEIVNINKQTLDEIFEVSSEEVKKIIETILKEESYTHKFNRKDKIYNANFTLKRDMFKDPLCILCVVNDVTNEEHMIKEVLEANNAKSDFLASMSHEIRTPINAIIGMNEMIIRECEQRDIVNYALDVESSSKMLLSLVNDILDFSKVESGKMEIISVEYDLASLLNDINNMHYSRAKEKGLNFSIEVDENTFQILYGDEIRIRQIINNLLTNAIKYTEKGYVKLSVYGKMDQDKYYLYMSVEDSGKGIKEQDQQKLFESFTRVDEINNRTIEGTGLGLALTRNFAHIMGGELTLKSEYGKGSTFTAYIEQGIVDNTPIGDFAKKIRNITNELSREKNSFSVEKCKILVVDDVEMNCKVFCGLLKDTGIEIDSALSGMEAIEKCKNKKYDIIYMDHRMPIMDGIECLHRLKEMDTINFDTPIVALTANAISGMKEMYLNEGFDDYLSKPIDIKYLEKSVKKYVSVSNENVDNIKEADDKQGKNDNVLEKLGINTELGLKYCMNDEEFYLEILKEYVKGDKTNQLLGSIEIKNFKDFRTHIHAVKSTSLNIGAEELSLKAKLLEEAAQNENIEYIYENLDSFMKKYSELIEQIKKVI